MNRIEELQVKMTEINAKIDSLAFLLQIAEPSMHRELFGNSETLERLMNDTGAAIRDYTDKMSEALSDLLAEAEV